LDEEDGVTRRGMVDVSEDEALELVSRGYAEYVNVNEVTATRSSERAVRPPARRKVG
jgi:hypothetical protein